MMRDCWVLVGSGPTHTARSGRRAGHSHSRVNSFQSLGGI